MPEERGEGKKLGGHAKKNASREGEALWEETRPTECDNQRLYFLRNLSTRPAVSMIFCLPV